MTDETRGNEGPSNDAATTGANDAATTGANDAATTGRPAGATAPGADAPRPEGGTIHPGAAAGSGSPGGGARPPSTDTAPTAPDAAAASALPAPPPRPRVRFAAVVWGIVVAAIAATLVWVIADPARTDAAIGTLLAANPALVVVGLLLAAGVSILLGSLLAAVHRWQARGRGR